MYDTADFEEIDDRFPDPMVCPRATISLFPACDDGERLVLFGVRASSFLFPSFPSAESSFYSTLFFVTPRNPPPKTFDLKSSPEREARKYYAPGGFGDKEISIRAILSSTKRQIHETTTSSIIIELREVFEHHVLFNERRDFARESGNGCLLP